MLDRLTVVDFEPLVGAAFAVEGNGPSTTIDLLSVTPARSVPAAGRPPFSLLFRAQGPNHWGQGTYPLSNERLGRLDLFLVPVGRDAGGMLLEAVFN